MKIEISDDAINAIILADLEIQIEAVLDQLQNNRKDVKRYSGYYSNDRKLDRAELKKDLKALTRVMRMYT